MSYENENQSQLIAGQILETPDAGVNPYRLGRARRRRRTPRGGVGDRHPRHDRGQNRSRPGGRKNVALVLPAADVTAHSLPECVVVVVAVAHLGQRGIHPPRRVHGRGWGRLARRPATTGWWRSVPDGSEAPAGAVRQNAPADLAGGQAVDAQEVAQHLRRRRGLLAPPPERTVERSKPSFRLHDIEAVLVVPPLFGETVGTVLRGAVCEQQSVRHVLPADGREVLLLRLDVQPSRANTGQIRSSSVWLWLGARSKGKRSNRPCNAASRSPSAAPATSCQSGGSVITSRKKVFGEEASPERPTHRHPRSTHVEVERSPMTSIEAA